MKVIDKIKNNSRTISIEIEPPALGKSIAKVESLLDSLVDFGISYVDVTYHHEEIVGSIEIEGKQIAVAQKKKPGTLGVSGFIKARYKNYGIEPVPHVICTGFDKYTTEEFLVELSYLGIENLLALKGDNPKGANGEKLLIPASPIKNNYANELIGQIANLGRGIYVGAEKGEPIGFCVGAGCYPEKHANSKTLEEQLKWDKVKVDAGADYLVTQMFFDNRKYDEFVDSARKAGINVPIIPGLKPLTKYTHLKKLVDSFGCSIPEELKNEIEKHRENSEAVRQAGIEWCINQARELRKLCAPGIHFYAARNAPIKEILKQL